MNSRGIIPDNEKWLYENPDVKKAVLGGLEKAKRREFSKNPPDLSSEERSPSISKYFMTNNEMVNLCHELARQIRASKEQFDFIYGIPRGGLIPAVYLSHILDIPLIVDMRDIINEKLLIVEDVVDTGKTLIDCKKKEIITKNDIVASIVSKSWSNPKPDYYAKLDDRWIVFPWEKE